MEVDQNVLQVALAKAISEAVPADMQKEIFTKALYEHLFKPNRNGDSPVSEAFQRALNDATKELAQEVVRDPENMRKVKEVVQSALDKALTDGSLLTKITGKFSNSFGY